MLREQNKKNNDIVHTIRKCKQMSGQNIFQILSLDDDVSQYLQNPAFVSILGKKWIFSKGHPYSIFKLVY